MSRFMRGDSVQIMAGFPDASIDFILTDPPYLVGFKDRSGRSIANDVNDEWVLPASRQMFRVLKNNSLAVSFYGWNVSVTFIPSSISSRVSYHGHFREHGHHRGQKHALHQSTLDHYCTQPAV
ncbi:hypothetical protein CG433_22125 [Pantoea ananatis]|nr:hypothetical protein CG433_22125 [Pantoea ananatis]